MSPLSPVAPVAPLSPVAPVSPRMPRVPALEVEIFFEERLGLGVLEITSGTSLTVSTTLDVFRNVTSKIEYTEENKSLTTTQIEFRLSTDAGRGFFESPIISEKIPS